MVAPGYGYGIVAMAALGYGGPQSLQQLCIDLDFSELFISTSKTIVEIYLYRHNSVVLF